MCKLARFHVNYVIYPIHYILAFAFCTILSPLIDTARCQAACLCRARGLTLGQTDGGPGRTPGRPRPGAPRARKRAGDPGGAMKTQGVNRAGVPCLIANYWSYPVPSITPQPGLPAFN